MRAYRDAMEQLSAKYRDDTEAATFYALSLAAAADPADKSYADLLKAGGILEALWQSQPDHPGLPHYIIHSSAVPARAPGAFQASRAARTIATARTHSAHRSGAAWP